MRLAKVVHEIDTREEEKWGGKGAFCNGLRREREREQMLKRLSIHYKVLSTTAMTPVQRSQHHLNPRTP